MPFSKRSLVIFIIGPPFLGSAQTRQRSARWIANIQTPYPRSSGDAPSAGANKRGLFESIGFGCGE